MQSRPGPFVRLARRLASLKSWRRYGAAVICGLLASAALPPLHLVILLLPAFTGLLWLLDGVERPRRAFALGWSFGFGYFVAGLYWVGIAFFVDAERFAVLMPFGVSGLAAGMALFPGLALYLVARLSVGGAARVFVLAAAWLLTEWLRSWFLTGFPWNLLGSVWTFSPAVLQSAALGGVWLLSVMTVLAAASPALLAEPASGPSWRRRCLVAVLLALPLLAWAGGSLRLAMAPDVGAEGDQVVHIRIVQPAIPQHLKWQSELRRDHVVKLMNLSLENEIAPGTHLVWPETAVPYFLAREQSLRDAIAKIIPPDAYLLTGAPRLDGTGAETSLWNSLHALSPDGQVAATYDKTHLVPFGEYVPLRDWISWSKFTAGTSDFQAGSGLRTIELEGLPPFSPLICYEAIFPGSVVRSSGDQRPEWLLNITNDAWFGTSSGPYQHFAAAQLRAVEEGLPLVRAANNGISGVVDPYGRIVEILGLDESGYLDVVLPRPTAKRTFFARFGNWTIALLFALLAAVAFLLQKRKRA